MADESQVEQIELSIEQAKAYVQRRDAMHKLIKNPDFDAIVTRGYFDVEAARLVMAKAEPNMQSPEAQASLDKQIIGVGYARLYFRSILQLGDVAARDLAASETELDRAEEEESKAELKA